MSVDGPLEKRVLLVSAVRGAEACATAVMQQLGLKVEIAAGRNEAVEALRRGVYAAVIVEEALAEGDPRGADLLWKLAGFSSSASGVIFGITAICDTGSGAAASLCICMAPRRCSSSRFCSCAGRSPT